LVCLDGDALSLSAVSVSLLSVFGLRPRLPFVCFDGDTLSSSPVTKKDKKR